MEFQWEILLQAGGYSKNEKQRTKRRNHAIIKIFHRCYLIKHPFSDAVHSNEDKMNSA